MAKEILQADLGGAPLSADELAAVPDFQGIRKELWDKFPGAIARKTFRAGEILMREGESGTTAFYIRSGSVDIYIQGPILPAASHRAASGGLLRGFGKITQFLTGAPSGQRKSRRERTHIPVDASIDLPIDNPIATLEAGDLIGELAALAALKQERLKRPKFYPRSATVRARTDVEVFEMLPNILNNVLYNSPAFKEKLNRNYRERALAAHFRSVPLFRDLSQEFLDTLRDRVELVDVLPGQVICKQGEVADAFYLIRLGFVKVSQDFPGGELVLTYLSRGSYFGEMGLLPPAFRVRAKGTEAGQIADGVLSGDPLVCGRAPSASVALPVPWDEYISREHFQLAVEGRQVRVKRLPGGKNPITYRMKPVNEFLISPGEEFLVGSTTFTLLDDPAQTGHRTATCTAMDFVQLVKIKGEDFAEMMERFPDVAAAVTEVARARRQMDAELLSRVRTVSLNDFLKQELMQGQNLLLIDLTKCTRCDECVKACVSTHDDGVTRLIRDGMRFDKYLAPTSCRACMDPLCMTRCPVGSIRRKETLDIVIEDWCIGCGNCATDCPYGNINVVEIFTGAGKSQKAEARPKAVVCDLCVEYKEPNCVRACPHDAALRVEPKTFFARELAGLRLAVPGESLPSKPRPGTAPALDIPMPANIETRVFSSVDERPLLPQLKVLTGPRAGSTLQLRIPATTFGRGADNDYRFADDTQLSRNHCAVEYRDGRYSIRDLGSTNGTFVNGNQISEVELQGGDVVEFGELKLEFQPGQFQ
jgi:CRP-like cAMP-binding protein/Fe-S-cluster-containing hydrogenase component 2